MNIAGHQELCESLLDLLVWKVQSISAETPVITFDGQIAALIYDRYGSPGFGIHRIQDIGIRADT